MSEVDISIVVPVYNEKESIEELYSRLSEVCQTLKESYEIIFVDDGSNDGSYEILKKIRIKDKKVKIIRFQKNFGKTSALSAGFKFSKGKIIVTMDADLQNDPQDIPKLLEVLKSGYDFVNGWRFERNDPFLKKITSKLFNLLVSTITGVKLHDHNCGLKAFKREIVENLSLYGDLHRYLPALANWYGAKITETKVKHKPRRYGKSKFGFKRLVKGMVDLIVVKFLMDYSTRPMHFFGTTGIISFLLGFLVGLYLVIEKIVYGTNIGDRPLLILSILLILVGVQLLMIGLLGEILIRIYYQTTDKQTYVIEEIIG